MTNVKPLRERVIVKRVAAERRTEGGLIIPEVARRKHQQAEVLAVGPGRLLADGSEVRPAVNPGDKIVLGRYGGVSLTDGHDPEQPAVIKESEILAVIRI